MKLQQTTGTAATVVAACSAPKLWRQAKYSLYLPSDHWMATVNKICEKERDMWDGEEGAETLKSECSSRSSRLKGTEEMSCFIPADLGARNCVLSTLLGLFLRSRHISVARNGDVSAYSELLKKPQWSVSLVPSHTYFIWVSQRFSQDVRIDNRKQENNTEIHVCGELLPQSLIVKILYTS